MINRCSQNGIIQNQGDEVFSNRASHSLLLSNDPLTETTRGGILSGMRGVLLCLTLLRASASFAAEAKTVDASSQFPGAAVRDQGNTNGCHVFSTVALLEAAVSRRWKITAALSEADLFVRKIVKDPDYYKQVAAALANSRGAEPAYRFVEAGDAPSDIDFAIKNGIATAETAPWPAFAQRYADFQKQQRTDLNAHDGVAVSLAGAQESVKGDFDEVGRQEMAGRMDYFGKVQEENLRQVQMSITLNQLAAQRTFQKFLAQVQGRTQTEGEDMLLGKNPELAKDRARYRALLYGFRVDQKSYDSAELTDEACDKAGAQRKAALVASFDRAVPVPVGLSMDVGGLKEWNITKGPASHAFTVVGYTSDAQGRISLHSRNSWGGFNPDVPESRFCRISRIVKVLTDQE
jgi:hypothetical protein